MFNHWQTIEKLGKELNEKISGYEIKASFSKSKDEYYIEMYNGKTIIGLKNIFNSKGLFFIEEQTSYKLTKDIKQFQEIVGEIITEVITFNYERCFYLKLTHEKGLLFKCFGAQANIIYYHNNIVKDIFRKNILNDLSFDLNKISKSEPYISNKKETNMGSYMLIENNSLNYYNNGELIKSYNSTLEGLSAFSKIYLGELKTQELKTNLLAIQNQIVNKAKIKISQVKNKLNYIHSERPKDEIANIILANLIQFENKREAEVYDFYNDQQITIVLKKDITATQFCNQLYQKHKNKNIQIEYLHKQIEGLEKQLSKALKTIEYIENSSHFKELDIHKKEKTNSENKEDKFKFFEIEEWKIYVGKNAKNNEELTFGFASKNDLWLHARGFSGSHVVIKNIGQHSIPMHIIKHAAHIAAFYSKGKNSSLINVDYTYKKHVSRIKKGAIGQVQLNKYLSIDVEPIIPNK